MPTEIYLIKSGMTMTEGVVEEWYIADGDSVQAGELLYRLETEKINLDVDAEVSGVVRHLVGVGETREPGDVIGMIFDASEEIPDDIGAASGGAAASAPAPASAPASNSVAETSLAQTPGAASTAPATPGQDGRIFSSPAARRLASELGVDFTLASGTGPGGRIVEIDVQQLAQQPVQQAGQQQVAAVTPVSSDAAPASSPVARKLARELNVDLTGVPGTGPGGRITKEDVERAHASPTTSSPVVTGNAAANEVLKHSGMRKTIARRMHESLQEMAQLTMDMDVTMDDAIKLRSQLIEEWAAEDIKPGYNDLVIRACAKALETHRLMNSSFSDTALNVHGDINVGMAVALDEGLIVPVVKNANLLGVKALCAETARLARSARDNALTVDELQDGTFTVSALGMFGVDAFTPIINSPQAGIMGVNRLRDDVRWEGNTPVKTKVMRLSLTWDHRVLDGAPAAQFLQTVKSLLESPYRLLI